LEKPGAKSLDLSLRISHFLEFLEVPFKQNIAEYPLLLKAGFDGHIEREEFISWY
jgi:hypothetical protein